MKSQDIILSRALKAFSKRQFSSVIKQLESHVFSYRNNSSFYQTLGLSCLFCDDIGGADTYLQRANQLNDKNEVILTALGWIQVRRREPQKAIRFWLECMDLFPKSSMAARALNTLRGHLKKEDLEDWILTEDFKKKLPFPRKFPWERLTTAVLVTAGIVVLSLLVFNFLSTYKVPEELPREGYQESALVETEPLISLEGAFQEVLTEDEVVTLYEEARLHFQNYRDNRARLAINQILLSNASSPIKDKARFLASYIRPPTFYTFQDNFLYKDVVKNPALYQDTYVMWKGATANVVTTPERISFDLLVGYHNKQVVEGIVPVNLTQFASFLKNGDGVEILAQVKFQNTRWFLDLIALHELRDTE